MLQLPHWVALSTLSIMKPVHLPYSLKCLFFSLLMKYEIWLETFSCCLLLTGQIFSAMWGWSFTKKLLASQDSFTLPSTSAQFQLGTFTWLFPLSDPWCHGKWRLKKWPPQIRMRKSRFLGTKNKVPDINVSASSLCHRRWPYSVIYNPLRARVPVWLHFNY